MIPYTAEEARWLSAGAARRSQALPEVIARYHRERLWRESEAVVAAVLRWAAVVRRAVARAH